MEARRSRRNKAPEHPYPGLRPFEPAENLIFFGMEVQTDELINRLRNCHFLAVLGPSGSGKSSLVLAGLLPALQSVLMGEAGSHWKMAVMRPGEHPVANLAHAMVPLISSPQDSDRIAPDVMLETMLRASSHGVREVAMGPLLRADENLLVVVDQFEEIFRFHEESDAEQLDEARVFVRLLLEATAAPSLPVYVVITMRSDFLGHCPRFRHLPEAINRGQYLVPRLTRSQMRESIVGPAAVFHGGLAPDLVVRMLNDVGDNPDQLPILQHALMRTWDHHVEGNEIVVSDYVAIGGLRQALNQHAEEIYAELEKKGLQKEIEVLFKSLTELESDGKGIRRPARLSEVAAAVGGDCSRLKEVIEAFRAPGRSFLMPPHPRPLERETILDISHESFMRLWDRLGDWVRVEAASAAQYRRLSAATRDYHAGLVNLWRQPELGIALDWRDASKPTAAWAARYDDNFEAAMTFLDDSLIALTRQEEAKAALELEQRRSAERKKVVKRLVIVITMMAALLGLSIYLTFFSLSKSKEALLNARFAKEQADEATRQKNAVAEQNEKIKDQLHQIQVLRHEDSIKGVAVNNLNVLLKGLLHNESISKDSIAKLLVQTKIQNQRIAANQVTLEQTNAHLEDEKGNAMRSALDANTKRALLEALQLAERSLETPNGDSALAGAIGAFLEYTRNGGNSYDPKLYNAMHGALERFQPCVKTNLLFTPGAFSYSPENEAASYVTNDGRLSLPSGVLIPKDRQGSHILDTRVLTETQDRRMILAADMDFHLLGYRIADGALDRDYGDHRAPVTAALEASVHKLLISGDLSGNVHAHALDGSKASKPVFKSPSGPVNALTLHPNGSLVVASPNAITVLALPSFQVLKTIPLVKENPTALAIDPAATKLVFGCEGGKIGVLNLSDGTLSIAPVHAASVKTIQFSSDGSFVASASLDQTVRVWRCEDLKAPPLILKGHKNWIVGLGYSADGKFLYSVSKDRTMRYWHLYPQHLFQRLQSLQQERTVQNEGEKK